MSKWAGSKPRTRTAARTAATHRGRRIPGPAISQPHAPPFLPVCRYIEAAQPSRRDRDSIDAAGSVWPSSLLRACDTQFRPRSPMTLSSNGKSNPPIGTPGRRDCNPLPMGTLVTAPARGDRATAPAWRPDPMSGPPARPLMRHRRSRVGRQRTGAPRRLGQRSSPDVPGVVSATRPTRWATAAACTRFDTPSLPRMFETWTLAVLRVRNSSSAISWFERPIASSRMTSVSRTVSPRATAGSCSADLPSAVVCSSSRTIRAWPARIVMSRTSGAAPSAAAVERAERRADVAASREPRDASCAAPSR